MKQISNSFMLTAAVNGKTMMARIELAAGSKGFAQSIARGSNQVSPSWDGGNGPVFRAVVQDTSGMAYDSYGEQLLWNGSVIEFDAATGLSTADSLFGAGTFKKESRTLNGKQVTFFTVMRNVFDGTNADSDSVQIRGKVALAGGHEQEYYTNEEVVTLVEVSGGGVAYHVEMSAVNIANGAASGTVRARLINLSTGTAVTGVTPTWYNMSGTQKTTLTNGSNGYAIANAAGEGLSTLTVPADNVNGDELFAAEFTTGGQTYIGFANIHDFNDPYFAAFEITGDVVGTQVEENGTATVRPFIADSDGNEVTPSGFTPAMVLKSATGTDVTSAVTTRTVSGKKVYDFTHDNLVTWGNYVTGYISIEVNT